MTCLGCTARNWSSQDLTPGLSALEPMCLALATSDPRAGLGAGRCCCLVDLAVGGE